MKKSCKSTSAKVNNPLGHRERMNKHFTNEKTWNTQ